MPHIPDSRIVDGAVVVTVTAHVMDVETGGWCDRCLTPAVVTMTVWVMVGGSVLSVIRETSCDRCPPVDV